MAINHTDLIGSLRFDILASGCSKAFVAAKLLTDLMKIMPYVQIDDFKLF